MGSVLVTYATRTQAARDVAAALADCFSRAGHRVRLSDLATEDPAVTGVDLVVVGSGIRATTWYPEALAWLSARASSLAQCPVAVFNTCLNAAEPDKRDEALGYNRAATATVTAVAEESFPGRYVREQVGWVSRLFLRVLRKPEQDHVNLSQARAWATTLAAFMPDQHA